jgi:hypothetical protein
MQRERDIGIGSSMFSQGQGIDQLGMGMLGLGGELGQMRSAANSAAMQNLIQSYGTGAGLMAARGRSMAGGLQGLGGSLGGRGVGDRMLSTGTIGGQNTWRDYTDNNGYGVG